MAAICLILVIVILGMCYRALIASDAAIKAALKAEAEALLREIDEIQRTQTKQEAKIKEGELSLREMQAENSSHKAVTAQQFERIDKSFENLKTQNDKLATTVGDVRDTLLKLVSALEALEVTKKKPAARSR